MRDDRSGRAGVVIVGGGVVGLAVAWALARRGVRPVVIDRGRTGGEASWAAAGMLAPVSEVDLEGPAVIELGLESLCRFPGFVADLEAATGGSCGYRTDGTLWVALNRDEDEEIERLASRMKERSLAARRLLPAEVLEREPHLSGRIVGGLRVEGDLQVDPRALLGCLEEAVLRDGGEVIRGSVVEVSRAAAGELAVRFHREGGESTIVAPKVVLAAGAWTNEGIRLPIDGPGVRPVKGQIVRLRGAKILRHVIRNPECYIVPREDGELLIGATLEEQGFDTTPTAGAVLDLLRHAWRILPALYDMELAEVSVGLRPAVVDNLPVIGESEVEGLYLATGHFRNGILLAPATAHYLAEAIATGVPQTALAPFAPDRLLARGSPGPRSMSPF